MRLVCLIVLLVRTALCGCGFHFLATKLASRDTLSSQRAQVVLNHGACTDGNDPPRSRRKKESANQLKATQDRKDAYEQAAINANQEQASEAGPSNCQEQNSEAGPSNYHERNRDPARFIRCVDAGEWFTPDASHEVLSRCVHTWTEGGAGSRLTHLMPTLDTMSTALCDRALSGVNLHNLGGSLSGYQWFMHPLMYMHDDAANEDMCMEFNKNWVNFPSGHGFMSHDSGYLKIRVGKDARGKDAYEFAHRIVCWAFEGPPGEGQQVCHTCHNVKCLNHRHLRWGLPWQNVKSYKWPVYKKPRDRKE